MRMTIHNARTSKKFGAFTPKHNDRNFNIKNAEHIDPERTGGNIYWNWTGESDISFEDAEKLFYEQHCRTHLDAKNARYLAQRHPERVRTMDEYRSNPRTCPEETILMIGNKDEYIPPQTLRAICEKLKDWEETSIPGLTVLNLALHVDEQGAPHIHIRRAWIYRDENGTETISQGKTLEKAGIPLPHPDKPQGRNNNRKQIFSKQERQALYEICRGYGLENLLEMQPREKSKSGRELEDYKAGKAEERAQAAEMRERAAEQAAEQARQEFNTIQAENRKLQQQNAELQEQVKQLQADRKWQHESLKKLSSARSERSKELKRINNTIRQKQRELEAIKEDVEEVKEYLTEGQQNRLAESDREWNDAERE
jgi:hypothetical protein